MQRIVNKKISEQKNGNMCMSPKECWRWKWFLSNIRVNSSKMFEESNYEYHFRVWGISINNIVRIWAINYHDDLIINYICSNYIINEKETLYKGVTMDNLRLLTNHVDKTIIFPHFGPHQEWKLLIMLTRKLLFPTLVHIKNEKEYVVSITIYNLK